MAHDWREVEMFAAGNPAIDVPAALPRDDIWMVTQFRANSAVSKMLALMLSYQDRSTLLQGNVLMPDAHSPGVMTRNSTISFLGISFILKESAKAV